MSGDKSKRNGDQCSGEGFFNADILQFPLQILSAELVFCMCDFCVKPERCLPLRCHGDTSIRNKSNAKRRQTMTYQLKSQLPFARNSAKFCGMPERDTTKLQRTTRAFESRVLFSCSSGHGNMPPLLTTPCLTDAALDDLKVQAKPGAEASCLRRVQEIPTL